MKTRINLKPASLFLILNYACYGCGYKADPEPFFATSPSNINNEVTRRKAEKNKPLQNETSSEKK